MQNFTPPAQKYPPRECERCGHWVQRGQIVWCQTERGKPYPGPYCYACSLIMLSQRTLPERYTRATRAAIRVHGLQEAARFDP